MGPQDVLARHVADPEASGDDALCAADLFFIGELPARREHPIYEVV